MALLRAIWQAISKALMAFGHFMSSYVVTPVLYFVVMAPFAPFARRGDPLRVSAQAGPQWHPRATATDDLESAARMH